MSNSVKEQGNSDDAIKIEKKQSPDSSNEKKTSIEKKEKAEQAPAKEIQPEPAPTSKKVTFRSLRANFTICMEAPQRIERNGIVSSKQGKVIRFSNYVYDTSDRAEIEYLRKLINSSGTDAMEVFEIPEVDELMQGDVGSRLEQMGLAELRQTARERNMNVNSDATETELRYAILKKLLLK